MCQHPNTVAVSSHSSRRMRINRDHEARKPRHSGVSVVTHQQGSKTFQDRPAATHQAPTNSSKGRRPACHSPKSLPCPPKQFKKMKSDGPKSGDQELTRETSPRASPLKQVYFGVPTPNCSDRNEKVEEGCHPPKPARGGSPMDRQAVPLLAYAGAKFSDPPSPKVLPKPPVHWVSCGTESRLNNCAEMSNILKVMLKVHA